jgi:hypothetical protein
MASRHYESCQGAADGRTRDVTFTVEEGATAEQVVEGLASERVIPCGGVIGNLLMRGTGRSGEIRAGTYSLTTGMTLDEAVEVLTTPPKQIPRRCAYRRICLTQIADAVEVARLATSSPCRRGKFDRPARFPPVRPSRVPVAGPTASKKDDADAVIQRLLPDRRRRRLPWERAGELG